MTKKNDFSDDVALVEEPETSSRIQALLNRNKRSSQQAFKDWRELCEAANNKEYVPQSLIDETWEAMDDGSFNGDPYTVFIGDCRELSNFKKGMKAKEADPHGAFIKKHGNRSELVEKVKKLQKQLSDARGKIKELDRLGAVRGLTTYRAEATMRTNRRLFPHT
jgi:hypothetical protein